jgi:hypothetical protein
VRANADTVKDAERARRFGGEGVGLCRTEHMFLGERRQRVERLILAEDDEARAQAMEALLPLQRWDFLQILTAMDGLPPAAGATASRVPAQHHRAVGSRGTGRGAGEERERPAADAGRPLVDEQNPVLGLRGVRLGLVVPGLFDLQVRAIAEATAQLIKMGKDPRPEIMIPLVGSVQELEIIETDAKRVLAEVAEQTGLELNPPLGTMIELPRGAMTAGQIAEVAEFFSFGTNDLTQTTWGTGDIWRVGRSDPPEAGARPGEPGAAQAASRRVRGRRRGPLGFRQRGFPTAHGRRCDIAPRGRSAVAPPADHAGGRLAATQQVKGCVHSFGHPYAEREDEDQRTVEDAAVVDEADGDALAS